MVGIVIKFAIQYPMIALFNVYGPTVATTIGMLVTCWLMIDSLYRNFHFKLEQTARRALALLGFSMIMFVVAFGTVELMGLFLPLERKIISAIVLAVAVGLGILVYGYLVLRTRIADVIIGARIGGLRERLHIK